MSENAPTLPPFVARSMARYLAVADRLLPNRIVGCYVIGSTALDAFRPDRSDIDLVCVVDGSLPAHEIGRVRWIQFAANAGTGLRALSRGQFGIPGTLNGVYVSRRDLAKPVTEIRPIASHTGMHFGRGAAFDVNPVMWKVFREHGLAVRGPALDELDLDPEPARLQEWNLRNLRHYWKPWAENVLTGKVSASLRRPARQLTSWGVLGPPRLHRTIATGDVISKEAAGEYALDVFPSTWHPLIREGLAFWRGEPADPRFTDRRLRMRRTAEFALEVVADAERL